MAQRVVTLTAGVSQPIVYLDSNDVYGLIMNIGTGRATLGFDAPAVDGQGYPLMPANTAGDQGGGYEITRQGNPRFAGVIHAISAAGTTLVILES